MMIDTNRIKEAILYQGTAKNVAERFGMTAQTVAQYRADPASNSYRNWKKMPLEKLEEIMSILNKEEKEMESKKQFEMDVEKYGKSVTFDEAISEIYANMPDELEIGDTQHFLLSGAQSNGNSVEFEFEVVEFDDIMPIFEYTGDYSEK